MEYSLLKFLHVLGTVLIGGGLIGVWMSDLRSRQLSELHGFAEAVRNIAVFYDGVVVPGALLLLGSGTWMIVRYYDGWTFLQVPWLAGMVALFVFEFIEGNTVTRLYFMRLRRLTRTALAEGRVTPKLEAARGAGGGDLHAFPRPAAALRHHRAGCHSTDHMVVVPVGSGGGPAGGNSPHRTDPEALPLASGEVAQDTFNSGHWYDAAICARLSVHDLAVEPQQVVLG